MPGLNSPETWEAPCEYIYLKNITHSQKIAFNYGVLSSFLLFAGLFVFPIYCLCKKQRKRSRTGMPWWGWTLLAWTELVLQGLSVFCATEQYSTGYSIKATALEEEWGFSSHLPSAENTTADQKASLLWCIPTRWAPWLLLFKCFWFWFF